MPDNVHRLRPRTQEAQAPIGRRPNPTLPDLTGLPSREEQRDPAYGEFLPAAQRIIGTPPSIVRVVTGYSVCGLVLVFLTWSLVGHLSLFAIAPGQVTAETGTQVVESQVAGQVAAIHVKDGDRVKQGDVLAELDPTVALADRAIIDSKRIDARAEIALRQVEITAAGKDPVATNAAVAWDADVPTDVRARDDGVLRAALAQIAALISDLETQRVAKVSERDKDLASITSQKSLIEAKTERTAMHEQLAKEGWDSRAKVLEALEPLRKEQVNLATLQGALGEAEASIAVLDAAIVKARDSFIAENTQKLAAAETQADALSQQLTKADQTLANLTLRAPGAGVVQGLALTTLGQNVTPGQQLMQVVPDGAPLQITAYVLNTDIGFVRAGQKATIKVDTFPYTRYGTIAGRVTKVAADAIPGGLALRQQQNGSSPESRGTLSATNPTQQTSDLVLPVTIVPDRATIEVEGRAVPLAPGMSVAVEIETERERVIGYILYPLTRALP